ncbi:MAG TPA: tetratricopeptide repeat protein [Gemmatimonadaceae bacterium]|nr:tetratricopeptide repeat protein [Gemmatimonadaceae bacterium]
MTDLELVTREIDALKHCAPPDVQAHLAPALNRFRFIPKAERRVTADAFFEWANAGHGGGGALRGYAMFFQAMDRFVAEELHAALALTTGARAILTEHDARDGVGLCAMLTGAIYRTFGNYDLALKTLWEAYELLKASGNHPVFLAATANSMGNIDFDMGHDADALSMFQVTFDESTRANDFYFKIYALHGLGRVYARQRKPDDAEQRFRQALELAEHHAHPLHISNSLTEFATFRFTSGDLNEAERLSQRALDIREEHRLLAGAVTNCARLADIRLERGQCTEALAVLQHGLEIAEALNVKPKMAQMHLQLSQVYERTHDPAKSLQHYKRFHALREDVEREDNARSLADARAVFEAEQTRKENAIIRGQKEEIERKNVELQDTIDELTRAKIGRKAKAFTLAVAVVLFIFQDAILGTVLKVFASSNYFTLLGIKMAIIFSLSPINRGIERYLLRRVTRRRAAA